MKRWTIWKQSWPNGSRGEGIEGPDTQGRVEVIPADSPNVLSEEEAGLWIKAWDFPLTDEEMTLAKATAQRLSDFAKEGSDCG